MKFRKKPAVVDAIQWSGSNWHEAYEFAGHNVYTSNEDGVVTLRVKTLDSEGVIWPGDWLMKGVKGEFYPCRADIFTETYERADIPEDPLLGLATTRQLLAELEARAEIGGYADYTTVSDDTE